MVQSSSESQQTQTFSVDHENVLPEHYRLIELIGRGGMAEVYLAEDRRLGRKVAIKFLTNEFRRDPDRVRRFRQEARSASALNHPNILIIHDIGDGGGVQFIVSEYVEGETLGTRIAQGRLPIFEAVQISIQVASALSAAHSAGIVHRDIKPDNIMIRNDGVVKVLDFGLAKARGFSTANGADFDAMTIDSGSTSPGLIVGTPQYMSPEQARGKELDGRTDIFSLGIVIFEMVTRHSPFAGGSFADTMAAILTKEPKSIKEFVDDAPPRLVELVGKCLQKDLGERFASIADLEGELKLLLGELPNSPRDTAAVDPAKSDRTQIRPTNRHSIRRLVSNTFQKPSPIAAVIILAAAGILMGGWWAWNHFPFRSATPSLMRTVPITSWSSSASELVTSASFSPDGKLVAFAARKGDSTEIWVKPVVGGDPVQVTKNGGYNQYPVWSPDGQQIAFLSNLGNNLGLWRIPFTGGSATRIVSGLHASARLVHWGKDATLYFQSFREFLKVTENSQPVTVTNLADLSFRSVEISPDEQRIAYSVKDQSGWKIKIRELDGGPDREAASTAEQIDYLSWHPNSQDLFASFLVEGSLQVFEIPINGSGAIQHSNGDINFIVHDVAANGSVLYGTLTETSDLWRVDTRDNQESIVANEVASEFWPDVSPDGAIAYQSVSRVEQPEAGSIRTAQNLSSKFETVSVSPSGSVPAWSNSGEWIAFLRRVDSKLELWKVRRDGLDLSKIGDTGVTLSGYYMTPYLRLSEAEISWSPDDHRIAFAGVTSGGSRMLFVETEGERVLHEFEDDLGNEMMPIWKDDRKSLAYISRTGTSPRSPDRSFRVLIGDAETLKSRMIYETKLPLRLLGFADNGNSLIAVANPDILESSAVASNIDVLSISIDSAKVRKLQTLRSVYQYNTFLPETGDRIAYVTRKDDRTAIVTAALAGGSPIEHVVINDPKVLISSLGLSRDGSFIVFGKQTRTNLLSMLTN